MPRRAAGDFLGDAGPGEDGHALLRRHERRGHRATEQLGEGRGHLAGAPVLWTVELHDPPAGPLIPEERGRGAADVDRAHHRQVRPGSRKVGSTPCMAAASATSPQVSTK